MNMSVSAWCRSDWEYMYGNKWVWIWVWLWTQVRVWVCVWMIVSVCMSINVSVSFIIRIGKFSKHAFPPEFCCSGFFINLSFFKYPQTRWKIDTSAFLTATLASPYHYLMVLSCQYRNCILIFWLVKTSQNVSENGSDISVEHFRAHMAWSVIITLMLHRCDVELNISLFQCVDRAEMATELCQYGDSALNGLNLLIIGGNQILKNHEVSEPNKTWD